mgnify:CR=1 FL=1
MRVFFTLIGCPFCMLCEEAITMINTKLPIGEKIEIVDVFSRDPRLRLLEAMYNSSDPYVWEVPVLVLDKPVIANLFKGYFKDRGQKILLEQITTKEHYFYIIKRFVGSVV